MKQILDQIGSIIQDQMYTRIFGYKQLLNSVINDKVWDKINRRIRNRLGRNIQSKIEENL